LLDGVEEVKSPLLVVVSLLVCCANAGPSTAQEPAAQTEQMLSNCKAAYDKLATENRVLKSKGYEAKLGYLDYFYRDYARKRADIQLNTFVWQARASEILIWVVVIVCLSGVIFSGFQLWRATAPTPSAPKAPVTAVAVASPAAQAGGGTASAAPVEGDAPSETSLELSWQSVRITSSVIGLVVLVISVAYLYLFLKEVYDIKVAGPLETSSSATSASGSGGHADVPK
jgi:hypothetical protein